MAKSKRVLVTGGAGFIGSHLVDALLSRGDTVTVLDDLSSGRMENVRPHAKDPRFRLIRGSILSPATLRKACRGADLVFHLAVRCIRLSIQQPVDNHEVNATGSLLVCEACRRAGVKRLVYVSSSEVYGTALGRSIPETDPCMPTTVYGGAKLAGEAYARAYHRTYGLPTIIVRPFNTYGPREHYEGALGEVIPKFMIRLANGLPPVIQGDGRQTRDFTYVTDTARGILLASGCDALVGDAVNIGNGKEHSIRRIADMLGGIVGSKVRPVHQPARPGDVRRHHADVTRARRLLGFRPEFGLREGLRRYWDWLRTTYDLAALAKQEKERNWILS